MAATTNLIDVNEASEDPAKDSLKPQISPSKIALPPTNPFRNPAAVKGATSPLTPGISGRPESRNPFLDTDQSNGSQRKPVPVKVPAELARKSQQPITTEQLFENLVLDEKEQRGYGAVRPVRQGFDGPARKPLPLHRPTRSQESQEGIEIKPDPSGLNTDRRVLARRAVPRERQRRNSDTSIVEDEKRRRSNRRAREGGKVGRKELPSGTRPSRRLDIIDKLDVTSIYGVGVFHHDGPFDALNPHRNRKLGSKAPLQAFPEGSANNALGGPTQDPQAFHNQFLGHAGAGAYAEYANGNDLTSQRNTRNPMSSASRLSTFNPLNRAEPVHGEETPGLGTSTFLDQTPAPRAAVQFQEHENSSNNLGGIARKKSIAQRIRGINRERPTGFHPSGSLTSPEGQSYRQLNNSARSPHEKGTPFFNEYGKKDAVRVEEREVEDERANSAEVAEQQKSGGDANAVGNSTVGTNIKHVRTTSAEFAGEEARSGISGGASTSGGGFLNRVKSLKGRKPRVERREL